MDKMKLPVLECRTSSATGYNEPNYPVYELISPPEPSSKRNKTSRGGLVNDPVIHRVKQLMKTSERENYMSVFFTIFLFQNWWFGVNKISVSCGFSYKKGVAGFHIKKLDQKI